MAISSVKQSVHDFWDRASCGEELYLSGANYAAQAEERYRLEPFIAPFARFEDTAGKRVLEVGVGLGADHQRFAEAGADLYGIDLTERAVEHTAARLRAFGLSSQLATGDAEHLDFPDAFFDVVYSWGVIHHSPDTPTAAREILRVLKPGGQFRVMVYHKYSLVGFMLWARYGALKRMSLSDVYSTYLESPGTKAYTLDEAKALFSGAVEVKASTVLTHGDLLTSMAGQRHEGRALAVARAVWPRALLRRFTPWAGLMLLIEGRKAAA
jgi:SAM-dependent methyltransferase